MNQLVNYCAILTAIEGGVTPQMATSTYARYAATLSNKGLIYRSDAVGRPYVLSETGAELLPAIRKAVDRANELLAQITSA